MNNPISVLIVDDNNENRKIVSKYLLSQSFSVLEAQNADETIQILDTIIPDAILMDYQMPGLDGLKTIDLIREKNQHSTIIMMTAYTSQEVVVGAIHCKVDYFLSKPLDFKNLGEVIISTIEKRFLNLSLQSDELPDLKNEKNLLTCFGCYKNDQLLFKMIKQDELFDNNLNQFSTVLKSIKKDDFLKKTDLKVFEITVGEFHFIMKIKNDLDLFIALNESQYQWAVESDFLEFLHIMIDEIYSELASKSLDTCNPDTMVELIKNKLFRLSLL